MAYSSVNESSAIDGRSNGNHSANGTSTYPQVQVAIIAVSTVSSVCLAATVFIQVVFWKHNRNAKIMLCHAFSMAVYYSVGTVRNFYIYSPTNPLECYVFFVVMYYFLSSALIWMSVMSYDVWLFLSELQQPMSVWRWQCPNCGCNQRTNLFLYYSVVAWGIPLLFLTSIMLLDNDRPLQEALDLYPEIAKTCWYLTKRCIWIFTIVPLIVLCVFNYAFFVLTVTTIRQTRRNLANAINVDRSKELFIIYIKLFIIIGVVFQGGLLADAILFTSGNKNVDAIGYLTGCPQGIAVFLAYFCKRSTFAVLKQRFCAAK